ncbi:hypothetical protein ACFQ0B_16070 [Nonomuraea thailandensis]
MRLPQRVRGAGATSEAVAGVVRRHKRRLRDYLRGWSPTTCWPSSFSCWWTGPRSPPWWTGNEERRRRGRPRRPPA